MTRARRLGVTLFWVSPLRLDAETCAACVAFRAVRKSVVCTASAKKLSLSGAAAAAAALVASPAFALVRAGALRLLLARDTGTRAARRAAASRRRAAAPAPGGACTRGTRRSAAPRAGGAAGAQDIVLAGSGACSALGRRVIPAAAGRAARLGTAGVRALRRPTHGRCSRR
jgi:hypothetical protein